VKLVVISNNPVPYHTPILNALGDRVDLEVIYMSRKHPLRSFRDPWGSDPRFRYSFHRSARLVSERIDFRIQFSVGVSRSLSRLKPDALLVSSWGPLTWEPLAWARARSRTGIIWAESTAWSGLTRSSLSDSFRGKVVHLARSYVANGTAARDYIVKIGAPRERVVTSCLPSPLMAADQLPGPRSGAPRFLFVGRLIERKQPLQLIEAFETLLGSVPGATMTIVGAGPLSETVEAAARRLGGAVRIVGRLEGHDLIAHYDDADVLVHAALGEVWGLVVNEALSRGLFVVASNQVGAALDLVRDDVGRIVEAGDRPALVNALLDAAAQIMTIRERRLSRIEVVRCCTPESFADDIVKAAELGAAR
jgi:glycosyltransferase involved in cell wall biosynthesis